ncbi:hypothetical protein KI387_006327, partial [Taxus chinensis]
EDEIVNTLNNGDTKVKGLTIKVIDEILAKVTGLPAQGEPFPNKDDPEAARREFADNGEEFILYCQ